MNEYPAITKTERKFIQEIIQRRPKNRPFLTKAAIDLMPGLQQLAIELFPYIQRGDYSIMITEGHSAKFTAAILRQVIKKVCPEKEIPIRVAVAGDQVKLSDSDIAKLEKSVADAKANYPDKKAVIITEFIEDGHHVRVLREIVSDKLHMPFDVAAVGILHAPSAYNDNKGNKTLPATSRLYFGQRKITPTIYTSYGLPGRDIIQENKPITIVQAILASRLDLETASNHIVASVINRSKNSTLV